MTPIVRRIAFHAIVAAALASPALASPALAAGPAFLAQPEQPAEAEPPMTVALADQLWNAGKFEEAAKAYEALLEQNPQDGRSAFRAAFAWHTAGKLDKAIEAHKRAAKFEQARPTALYNLGCAFALKGDKDKAFDALMQARKAGFDQLDHMRQDSDLESLRDDGRFESLFEEIEPEGADAKHRELDFWVGEWDVYARSGKQVGTNRIELVVNNHVILEHWTNTDGQTGKSMNYFAPAPDKWPQVGGGGEGDVLTMRGRLEDGAITMVGETAYLDGSPSKKHRTTLTPNDDGTVRQFIEESADGAEWKTLYDLLYVPKGQTLPDGWAREAPRRQVGF